MHRVCSVAFVAVLGLAPARALDWTDDFSERRDGWETPSGDWAWEEGTLRQRNGSDAYYMALREQRLTEGAITVVGAANAANSSGDGCIGIVCKYLDSDNWVLIRFGAYGRAFVMTRVEGKREIHPLRPFIAEIGREYRCVATLCQGLVFAEVDGRPMGVWRDPFAGQAGRPGLYAQSPAEFSSFHVGQPPQMPDLSAAATAALADGPQVIEQSAEWRLEAVEYAAAPLSPTISGPDRYTLALYVRNGGTVPAEVTDVTLDGEPASALIEAGRLSWWRSWPETVPPGAVAQVLIKSAGISLTQAAQVMLGAPMGPHRVRLSGSGQGALEVEFALDPRPAPLCINFIAFDEGLRTLHVYLAARGELVGRRIERVEVNGEDVTGRVQPDPATVGLRADTLPLRVALEHPLEPAAPVVVTVRAQGGDFAGHAVRAFPSTFPIQVVILGKQPGAAEVAEIANLCFTEVGFCGARFDNMAELARNGLSYFPYAYPGQKSIEAYLAQPQRPPLTAWWIDEIDGWRRTPRDAQEMLSQADDLMRDKGLPVAPHCMNIMAPWTDVGYVELCDALSHEYGIDFGIADGEGYRRALDFRTPGDISRRELRIARRPWWPYFRNIEAAVLLEAGTTRIVGHYRPIDPREHRLIVYSCLANGAKGALNWNYGVNHVTPQQSTWLSKKHDAIRLNMTALKQSEAFGVTIPQHLLDGLREATHECGRVNAELQLLGPLLAKGDVSDLARIVGCRPEQSPRGGPAAHARAIVCGPDTLVLLAINLNIDSDFNARDPRPVRSYDSVAVDMELDLPQWLSPKDVFEVSCRGVSPVPTERQGEKLRLSLPALDVATAVIITSDRQMREQMATKLEGLQKRLGLAGVTWE